MNAKSNSFGICITCNHRSYCVSFQNGLRIERPVWHCNEYEYTDTDVNALAHVNTERVINENNPSDKINQKRTKGLCVNCDSRNFCMLPIQKGGVWHCEEYS